MSSAWPITPITEALGVLVGRITKLEAALEWVQTCKPERVRSGNVRIELTMDEFNAMRKALGLLPLLHSK